MKEALSPLPIGVCAALACQFEALAAKPGNVQRGADFEDLSLACLLTSGAIIAPWMESAGQRRVGQTILQAVAATRRAVDTNANLGIILLLAPLAAVPRNVTIANGIASTLAELNADDARDVYQAIRLARPGGLGTSTEGDVAGDAPADLIGAMRLAEERDLIARQYARGYPEVLQAIIPWLAEGAGAGEPLSRTIVTVHLKLMSGHPDTLILRKCGPAVAREASDRAAEVLSSAKRGDEAYERALADFDFWLRLDGHRRNPGATADLVAAGLFVALREGIVSAPFRFYSR